MPEHGTLPGGGRVLATVGALVIGPSGRLLFTRSHKWRGRWGVPGGKIDVGETVVAALKREFAEETGLLLDEVFWGPSQESVNSAEFYKPVHMIMLNFIATCKNERVSLNDEAQCYAWLRAEQALHYELNSPTRTLLDYYLARANELEPV